MAQILILKIVKDICEQHTIVNKDGVKFCDTENCPFAKRSLDMNFHLTDWYRCIADYPYSYKLEERK